ncbi:MAG TPA: hypothetical protein VGD15_11780 [Kribbella sp.]|jgi:hypothetical protein
MRRCLPFVAVGALLLSLSACESEAKPPAADAKICEWTVASWWFDATGAPELTGLGSGDLPLRNPGQTDSTFRSATCEVRSEGKEVANFRAELVIKVNAHNTGVSLRECPDANKLTVAGGTGCVYPSTGEDFGRAVWLCKTSVLRVDLLKPKDKDSRDNLLKTLAQHIAAVTGCPGPDAS